MAVDVVQDGRSRPEVGCDSQDRGGVPSSTAHAWQRKVRLNVRAAKPVDCLFRISHKKQRALTNGAGFARAPA